MRDELDLAIKYGGFTSLDRVYLQGKLAQMTQEERLDFITPPPSVINAYFAEIYQKKGPQAATDYYLDLSRHLHLQQEKPSFAEEKPFVRLNLSDKAYGFAYGPEGEVAQVFSEIEESPTEALFFELAQIFPHYWIFAQDGKVYMAPVQLGEASFSERRETAYLLTELAENQDWLRLSGVNQEEVLEASQGYIGQRYYAWSGREALVYIRKEKG